MPVCLYESCKCARKESNRVLGDKDSLGNCVPTFEFVAETKGCVVEANMYMFAYPIGNGVPLGLQLCASEWEKQLCAKRREEIGKFVPWIFAIGVQKKANARSWCPLQLHFFYMFMIETLCT